MKRSPSEMSREELGLLFPIEIAEPNPVWPALFEAEKASLEKSLGGKVVAGIEHIGSTAVPGLAAKPTIDILLEIEAEADLSALVRNLRTEGYDFIPRPENPPPHMMFVKGYSSEGFFGQVYHVHVRYPGDWDELPFRDYLRTRPEAARAYAELKKKLAIAYRNDREAYTEAKTGFIREILRLAGRGRPNS